MVGGAAHAAHGLDQLFGQLIDWAKGLAAKPGVYDERRDPNLTGSETARNLAASLEEARAVAGELARRLQRAASYASQLGTGRGEEEPRAEAWLGAPAHD